jgi:RNA polymerase sigma factor (TIGR02999 family)
VKRKATNLFYGRPERVQQVYQDLRRMAGQLFQRERSDHTLQPTALVHEAFIRLAEHGPKRYASRAHFFGVVLRVMRQILVDHARRSHAQRRGGDWQKVSLEGVDLAGPGGPDFLALDAALNRLEASNPMLCRRAELRLFAGLSTNEIAALLKKGESTTRRDWSLAKAWLQRELEGESQSR